MTRTFKKVSGLMMSRGMLSQIAFCTEKPKDRTTVDASAEGLQENSGVLMEGMETTNLSADVSIRMLERNVGSL
jgi:hypothetical protein